MDLPISRRCASGPDDWYWDWVYRVDQGGVFSDRHLMVDCGLRYNPLSREDHG